VVLAAYQVLFADSWRFSGIAFVVVSSMAHAEALIQAPCLPLGQRCPHVFPSSFDEVAQAAKNHNDVMIAHRTMFQQRHGENVVRGGPECRQSNQPAPTPPHTDPLMGYWLVPAVVRPAVSPSAWRAGQEVCLMLTHAPFSLSADEVNAWLLPIVHPGSSTDKAGEHAGRLPESRVDDVQMHVLLQPSPRGLRSTGFVLLRCSSHAQACKIYDLSKSLVPTFDAGGTAHVEYFDERSLAFLSPACVLEPLPRQAVVPLQLDGPSQVQDPDGWTTVKEHRSAKHASAEGSVAMLQRVVAHLSDGPVRKIARRHNVWITCPDMSSHQEGNATHGTKHEGASATTAAGAHSQEQRAAFRVKGFHRGNVASAVSDLKKEIQRARRALKA